MRKHIFIDCEWTLDQNIFLIAYAYKNGKSGSIYGKQLSNRYMAKVLSGVSHIYVYGPDIAYMEKNFTIPFRTRYICINLLKLIKRVLPGESSYQLSKIETKFKIPRSTRKYKTSVFTIWKHWADLEKRKHVIRYNLEDTINLRTVFKILETRFVVSKELLLECRLT